MARAGDHRPRSIPGSGWPLLALIVWALGVGNTLAQPGAADDKPLPAEEISLKTTDGVHLAATYYPSRRGKDAACVILLSDDAGKRADLSRLALRLQSEGVAVIAPDLRGQGDSKGEFKQLRLDDYQAMIARDMEAVKGFLLKRNNLGELNIDRLGVIGVHLGASLALNWAALDWSWPELATGKQGQDVKALTLISPEWSYKGVRIGEAVVEPGLQDAISILIIVGQRNRRYFDEARRLYNHFARHHDISLPVEQRTLFFESPATSLQGLQLLDEPSLDVEQIVADFINLRLAKPAIDWELRKPPFG